MFWGLIMEPRRRYSQIVKKSFHVSMAALDVESSKSEPVQVMVTYEDRNYLICTLQKDTSLQVALDLNFEVGTEVSFATNGTSHVHLTGYINDDIDMEGEEDADEADEEAEDEDVEEEEEGEVEDLDESGDEEDETVDKISKKNITNGKRAIKPPTGPPAKKSKTLKLLEDVDSQEDDDDSDDSDVNFSNMDSSADALGGEEEEDDSDDDDEDVIDEEEDEKVEQEVKVTKKQKKEQEHTKKSAEGKKEKNKQVANGVAKPDKPKVGKDEKKKQNLEGGVIVEDLAAGAGQPIKSGRLAQVYYVGRLKSNNKVFDSTLKGTPFKFRIGKGEVIKGWDVGVVGMKVGGKRRITCPANMAYGKKGAPPEIPPNATLVFEVELKNAS